MEGTQGLSEADVNRLIREVMRKASGRHVHRMSGNCQMLLYYHRLQERAKALRLACRLRAFVATGKMEEVA